MTTTVKTMQEAALEYVDKGFLVFPCCWPTESGACGCGRNHKGRDIGKRPLTDNGFKDATQTHQGVKEYWTRWPKANIGWWPKHNIVLDEDNKNDSKGAESLVKMQNDYGTLPPTLTNLSGSHLGHHFIYKNPTDREIGNVDLKNVYPGIDIRGDRGYILLPPSLHLTGGRYETQDNLPIAEAPEWLITLLTTPGKNTNASETAPNFSDSEKIPQGRQDDWLYRRACAYRNTGDGEETIFAKLKIDVTRCEQDPADPFTDKDLFDMAHRACKFPAGQKKQEAINNAGSELPQIVVNGRPLRDVTTEAITAMQAANNPPRIFERGANPVRTNRNEQNRPFIELMSEAAMRGFMDRSADYMNVRQDDKDGLIYTHVHPPQDVVKDVLTVPQRRFPPLVGITPNPVIRANGTILSKPGYDAESKLYYEPEPGLKVPDIPDNPTKEQLQTAINLFIEPLCDFPFENDASEANALAVLMCPVIRPMIDGCVPLALFDKPQSGTGASLLAEVIALVATGTPAAMMAAPGDNEEWRKVITTTILSGDTILVIDNIEDTLQSAALSVLLTSRQWKGRILGRSEDILLPNILTPIGTGNNVRLGGDLPRRCVWIRMDAQTARPWMRKIVFKHPNLHEWIMQSRGAILAAILTIVRSWILAGSPQKTDQDILGGYESYSRILGGILEFIGVKGFLTNLTSMYDIVDTNIPAWEAFLTAWHDILKDREVTTAELITELNKLPEFKASLPDDYADMTVKNYQRRLGIAISSRKMARFPNGLKIEKTGETNRCAKWKVVDTNEKTPTPPPAPTQPKMSLDDFTITQDSYKNRHETSLNESSSNQTYEKNNNTVNTIYGVGAVQDSEDSLTESKKYESCLKAPAKLENTDPCPVCGSDNIGVFDDGAAGYYYCINCYPEFSKQNFEEEEPNF